MPKVIRNDNHFKIELTYEEEREKHLKKIKEADLLGETEEVTRLQNEWKQKKTKFGK